MGETRMVDKKFEQFLDQLRRLMTKEGFDFGGWSDQIVFLKRAFQAGRKAQREDTVEEQIADKYRVTNIG